MRKGLKVIFFSCFLLLISSYYFLKMLHNYFTMMHSWSNFSAFKVTYNQIFVLANLLRTSFLYCPKLPISRYFWVQRHIRPDFGTLKNDYARTVVGLNLPMPRPLCVQIELCADFYSLNVPMSRISCLQVTYLSFRGFIYHSRPFQVWTHKNLDICNIELMKVWT